MTSLAELVRSMPGAVEEPTKRRLAFTCPVAGDHRAFYYPNLEEVDCDAGCPESLVIAALERWAPVVAVVPAMVPPPCPDMGELRHSAPDCLYCTKRRMLLRAEAQRQVEESTASDLQVARLSSVDVDEPPEVPTIGTFGETSLFYRSQINGIHGRGGSMKSWIAYFVALQQAREGHAVLLLDYEVGLKRAARRLAMLGASAGERDRIVWVRPRGMLSAAVRERIVRDVEQVGSSLSFAVIDSVSRAMSGLSGNDSMDVTAWIDAVPTWVLDQWPEVAVLLIDHTSKGAPDSLLPTGAVQKYAAVQGSQFLVTKVRPSSRTVDGYSTLTCAKDQEGHHTEGEVVAQFDMGPSGVALRSPSDEVAGQAEAEALAAPKTRIVDVLRARGRLSKTELKKVCRGNAEMHTRARNAMLGDGDLIEDQPEGDRNSYLELAETGRWMDLPLGE